MAWTAPRTWTTGELVTASQLNTHLRDNLLAITNDGAPALVVGTTASTTGALRLTNAAYVYARNNAGGANLRMLGADAADTVIVGDTTGVQQVRLNAVGGVVLMVAGTDYVQMVTTTLAPVAAKDNTMTCGATGQRWSAVWATNGTIQTSSRAAKDVRGRIDPAAALAAVCATPLYAFTYKGDDPVLAARPQVGFMAEEADPLLCPDGASASPNTTASVGLAAIQALAAEVAALRAELAARREVTG